MRPVLLGAFTDASGLGDRRAFHGVVVVFEGARGVMILVAVAAVIAVLLLAICGALGARGSWGGYS